MSFWRRLFGSDNLGELEWSSWDRGEPERAPAGKLRVCAYHIDFDEHPSYFVDVDTVEIAKTICDKFADVRPENVDYAIAYDEAGERVAKGPW